MSFVIIIFEPPIYMQSVWNSDIQNQGSTYSTFGVEMIQYFPSTFLQSFD